MNRYLIMPWVTTTLLSSALWLSAPLCAASSTKVLHDVRSTNNKEQRLEISFTVTGWIPTANVDALARCLPKKERQLPKSGDAAPYFRGIRWEQKRLRELDACNLKRCVFNIPDWAVRKVMAASSSQDRLRRYYNIVRDLSWTVNKKHKKARIKPFRLKQEPCAQHNLFHWLLNGPPKSWDRIVWRKHFGSRMRPTLKTMQISSWRQGPHRCIGASVLFGDHYYYDGIDLLQLTPDGDNRVRFRLTVRERFDIFKEWWARRFRGTIRKKIRRRKIAIFRDRVTRCLNR